MSNNCSLTEWLQTEHANMFIFTSANSWMWRHVFFLHAGHIRAVESLHWILMEIFEKKKEWNWGLRPAVWTLSTIILCWELFGQTLKIMLCAVLWNIMHCVTLRVWVVNDSQLRFISLWVKAVLLLGISLIHILSVWIKYFLRFMRYLAERQTGLTQIVNADVLGKALVQYLAL